MESDLALIAAAVGFGFFVKAIAGFGGPLLAIPLLAPTIGVEHAVIAMSFGNVASNALMLWEHRRAAKGSSTILVPMLSAGVVGTVLGTRLLTSIDDRWISLVVAVTVIVYVILATVNPSFGLSAETGRKLRVPVGVVGGLMHGATGNSGPVFGTYVDSLGLPRSSFIFIVTVPFLVLSTVQIATLIALGRFTADRTTEALIIVIPVLVATAVGTRVARRIPIPLFRWIVLLMLTLAGLRLLISV